MKKQLIKKTSTAIIIVLSLIAIIMAVLLLGIAFNASCTHNVLISSSQYQLFSSDVTGKYPEYARPEQNTYLTFPEWYIVYSYDEYAAFLEHNQPSKFRYWASIKQYWQGYCHVHKLTKEYPFNTEYNVMLMVIGVSFSAEYAVKGLYENTFGFFTEIMSSLTTEEDSYIANVSKAYVDFINVRPFYEFSYADYVTGMWKKTSLWSSNPIRSWERKISFTFEYSFKAMYGWLIKQLTQSSSGVAGAETYTIIENLSQATLTKYTEVKFLQSINENSSLVSLPRYQAFTDSAIKLSQEGAIFKEIAGNDEIVVTLLAPNQWQYDVKESMVLFEMKIITTPELKRIALKLPVTSLHTLLKEAAKQQIIVEHIYDY